MAEKGEIISRKIIICYASVGSGDRAALLPLQKYLDVALYKFYDIELVDSLDFFSSFAQKLFHNSQLKNSSFWGGLYNQFWHSDFFIPSEKKLSRLFNYFDESFSKHILETNPRVIISSHTLPAVIIAGLKNKGLLPETLHLVINVDFRVHSFWPTSGVDFYISASEESEKDFMRMNLSLERVYALGAPIKLSFSERKSKDELRAQFIDNDLPAVIFLANSLQKRTPKDITSKLYKLVEDFKEDAPFNLLIVVGKDRELKNKLKKYIHDYSIKNMQVFGSMEQMDKIMFFSNLLITKPDGIISSEALAASLPMLLLGPNFGQERANRNYLIKKEAAVFLRKGEDLYKKTLNILEDYKQLEKMSNSAQKIAKPQAVKNIAALVKKNLLGEGN
jgi:processive 1,2-diacylglycerol beta-glucosyltransferase